MSMEAPVLQLITVSLGKIAASRCRKGGISLHRNLLVATVLHKARTVYLVQHYQAAQQLAAQASQSSPTTTTTTTPPGSGSVETKESSADCSSPTFHAAPSPASSQRASADPSSENRSAQVAYVGDSENTPPPRSSTHVAADPFPTPSPTHLAGPSSSSTTVITGPSSPTPLTTDPSFPTPLTTNPSPFPTPECARQVIYRDQHELMDTQQDSETKHSTPTHTLSPTVNTRETPSCRPLKRRCDQSLDPKHNSAPIKTRILDRSVQLSDIKSKSTKCDSPQLAFIICSSVSSVQQTGQTGGDSTRQCWAVPVLSVQRRSETDQRTSHCENGSVSKSFVLAV